MFNLFNWTSTGELKIKVENLDNENYKIYTAESDFNFWSSCLLFFYQMIGLQKLWKMCFISSKKLFSFSRYSDFCNFFPFHTFQIQMEVEWFMMS